MINLPQLSGIVNGKWAALCRHAILPTSFSRGIEHAPGVAQPVTTNVIINNGAFVFNGNGQINLGSQDYGTSNFSLTCRFKTGANITSTQGVAGCPNIGTGHRYSISIASNYVNFILEVGGVINISYAISANTEYIVTLSIDRLNNKFDVYINGILASSTISVVKIPSTGDFIPVNDFRIGAYADASNNPAYYFTGEVYETLIYNKALSSNEAFALSLCLNPGSYTWQSIDFVMSTGLFDFSWNGKNKVWLFPDGSVSTADRPAITLTEAGTVKLLYLRDEDIEGNYQLNDNNTDAAFVGDLSAFGKVKYWLALVGCINMTGPLSALNVTHYLNIYNAPFVSGPLSSLSDVAYSIAFYGCPGITGYLRPTCTAKYIYLRSCPNIDIDQTLINLAQNGVINGGVIQTDGTTPAYDRNNPDVVAAIATLEANYTTVTLN